MKICKMTGAVAVFVFSAGVLLQKGSPSLAAAGDVEFEAIDASW